MYAQNATMNLTWGGVAWTATRRGTKGRGRTIELAGTDGVTWTTLNLRLSRCGRDQTSSHLTLVWCFPQTCTRGPVSTFLSLRCCSPKPVLSHSPGEFVSLDRPTIEADSLGSALHHYQRGEARRTESGIRRLASASNPRLSDTFDHQTIRHGPPDGQTHIHLVTGEIMFKWSLDGAVNRINITLI